MDAEACLNSTTTPTAKSSTSIISLSFILKEQNLESIERNNRKTQIRPKKKKSWTEKTKP